MVSIGICYEKLQIFNNKIDEKMEGKGITSTPMRHKLEGSFMRITSK